MNNVTKSPIIVALDNMSMEASLTLADQLDPALCRLKVGKELFTRCGPTIVQALHQRDFDVFLDLKFHDIPNTTAQAVPAAADLGVWMVNACKCRARGNVVIQNSACLTVIFLRHYLLLLPF